MPEVNEFRVSCICRPDGIVASSYVIKQQCDPVTGRQRMVARPDTYREWVDPLERASSGSSSRTPPLSSSPYGTAAAGMRRPMSAPAFSSVGRDDAGGYSVVDGAQRPASSLPPRLTLISRLSEGTGTQQRFPTQNRLTGAF